MRRAAYWMICCVAVLVLIFGPMWFWVKLGVWMFPRASSNAVFGIVFIPMVVTYFALKKWVPRLTDRYIEKFERSLLDSKKPNPPTP